MTQSRNFLIRNNGSLGLYQKDVKGQKKSPQNVICILKKKIDITVEYEIRPRTMLFTVYLSFFCEGTVQNIGLDGGVKSTLFNSYSMYLFLFELLYFVHT